MESDSVPLVTFPQKKEQSNMKASLVFAELRNIVAKDHQGKSALELACFRATFSLVSSNKALELAGLLSQLLQQLSSFLEHHDPSNLLEASAYQDLLKIRSYCCEPIDINDQSSLSQLENALKTGKDSSPVLASQVAQLLTTLLDKLDTLSPPSSLPQAIKQRAITLISETSFSDGLSVLEFAIERCIHSEGENYQVASIARDSIEILETIRIFFQRPSQRLLWEASSSYQEVSDLMKRAIALTEPQLDHPKSFEQSVLHGSVSALALAAETMDTLRRLISMVENIFAGATELHQLNSELVQSESRDSIAQLETLAQLAASYQDNLPYSLHSSSESYSTPPSLTDSILSSCPQIVVQPQSSSDSISSSSFEDHDEAHPQTPHTAAAIREVLLLSSFAQARHLKTKHAEQGAHLKIESDRLVQLEKTIVGQQLIVDQLGSHFERTAERLLQAKSQLSRVFSATSTADTAAFLPPIATNSSSNISNKPEPLSYGSDGIPKWGCLAALVRTLCGVEKAILQHSNFIKVFLRTYRSFTSAEEIMAHLVQLWIDFPSSENTPIIALEPPPPSPLPSAKTATRRGSMLNLLPHSASHDHAESRSSQRKKIHKNSLKKQTNS